ncbi:MAG: response regulator transcription factor [Candidatus Competibacteraceae bacterium]|nr:response regulator transcription factor [Candidatus Competibacteraceae bacterium]
MQPVASSTQVLIAGSQPLLLSGLKALLEKCRGIAVCGEATDTLSLIQLAPVLSPDILIIDRSLESFFDEENLAQNDEFMEQYRVLLLSDMNKEEIYKLHKLKIQGFITTVSTPDELVAAIRTIVSGGKFFSSKVVEVLIQLSFKQPSSEKNLHNDLSEREMEIFRLVTLGKSTKEIAEELFLSTHTVYTHRKNILKKLSCKSATELINYAYTQGLMTEKS